MSEYNNVIRGLPGPVPGVDINTMIAEQILGWKHNNGQWFEDVGNYRMSCGKLRDFSGSDGDALWLADYCEVFCIEKLRKGWYCELKLAGGTEITNAHASTIAFAVSMAILRQQYTHKNFNSDQITNATDDAKGLR